MQKSQIFLVLIILIMPLSGCFGSSDEVDDTTETTVVNHYHYNNTTIIQETNESSGDEDSVDEVHTHYNNSTYVDNHFTNNTYVDNYYTNNSNYTNATESITVIYTQGGYWNGGPPAFNLSISNGELVQILEASYRNTANTNPPLVIKTDCGTDPSNPNREIEFSTTLTNLPLYLPGSSMDCIHTTTFSSSGSWSIVYTIHSITVI